MLRNLGKEQTNWESPVSGIGVAAKQVLFVPKWQLKNSIWDTLACVDAESTTTMLSQEANKRERSWVNEPIKKGRPGYSWQSTLCQGGHTIIFIGNNDCYPWIGSHWTLKSMWLAHSMHIHPSKLGSFLGLPRWHSALASGTLASLAHHVESLGEQVKMFKKKCLLCWALFSRVQLSSCFTFGVDDAVMISTRWFLISP